MPSTLALSLEKNLHRQVRLKRLALWLTTFALAACSSTPLPPWGRASSQSRPANASAQPVFVQPTPAQSSPVASGSAATAFEPATPAQPENLPIAESAAVSARFAAPSVVYSTPGLQTARTTFSTQDEIKLWLRDQAGVASRTPGVMAAVVPLGRSQRGEIIEALVLTRGAGADPAAVQLTGRPTVLLIGQQHGNEPAGSEALLVIARELAQGLLQPLLSQINVLIVPRANPDEANTDQRMTAGGLDLNRDHLLLNTPEVQALTALTRDFNPTVVVDLHEYPVTDSFQDKFGAVHKFDALLQYATAVNLPEFLTKAAEEWYRRPIVAALKTQGLSSEWYHTTSTDLADKKVFMGGANPDTARNVNGLKNRVSLLIETRGVGLGKLHIQRRVHTHVTALTSVLNSTAKRAAELLVLRPYIDKEVSTQACKGDAVIEAASTASRYELLMLDPNSGADKAVTVDWESALALRTLKSRARPCGYWLSAQSSMAVERLKLHGVQILTLAESGSMLGDSYREISRVEGYRQDACGLIAANNMVIKAQVSLVRAAVDVARGSYYVPLNQPLGNLVVAALEPDTPSSYFANQILPNLQATVRVMAQPNVKFEEIP